MSIREILEMFDGAGLVITDGELLEETCKEQLDVHIDTNLSITTFAEGRLIGETEN